MHRPTFHESWHRVSEIRPRPRATVRILRQDFRGQRWHVLEDPASGMFFRLNQSAYEFVARLDGRRSVDEAWRGAIGRLGDDALTQGEAIGLLGQMWRANLLWADAPADTRSIFERQRERQARERRGFISSLLFLRIPLFDPDPLLERWAPALGWIFGPIGAAVWIALLFTGIWHVVDHGGVLVSRAQDVLAGPNLLPLYLTYAAIKTVHELGHAVSCKVFGRRSGSGGEVHAIGVMLMLFLPVPYVDASSSWALRSRLQRIVVSAAGILVEMACAAVAAIVWTRTAEGTLTHAIAYNTMFIAGISTLLFNGNPLLRYDGYYVLSDLIEVPNLAQRSLAYLKWLVKSGAWSVRGVPNPSHSPREAAWLSVYGVLSGVYRVMVFAGLALFIASQQFLLGGAIILFGVVMFVLRPLVRFVHYLWADHELDRSRLRAIGSTLAAASVLLIPGLTLPLPDFVRAQGIAEPKAFEVIHAQVDGFVEHVAPSGKGVRPDESASLLEQRNDDLVRLGAVIEAELERLRVSRALAFRDDPARAFQIDRQITAMKDQASLAAEQLAALRIQAGIAGTWIAPRADHLTGSFVKRGEPIGLVADLSSMRLRVVLDQRVAPLVIEESVPDVDVRALGRPGQRLSGALRRVLPAGQKRLPSASLGLASGGDIPTATEDQDGTATTEEVFEAWIDLPAGHGLLAGQRVEARFRLKNRPILIQGMRALRQVLQERFNI